MVGPWLRRVLLAVPEPSASYNAEFHQPYLAICAATDNHLHLFKATNDVVAAPPSQPYRVIPISNTWIYDLKLDGELLVVLRGTCTPDVLVWALKDIEDREEFAADPDPGDRQGLHASAAAPWSRTVYRPFR